MRSRLLQGGDLSSADRLAQAGQAPRIAGQFSPQHEQRLLNMVQAFPQPGVAGRGVANAQLGYQFIDGAVGLTRIWSFSMAAAVQGGGALSPVRVYTIHSVSLLNGRTLTSVRRWRRAYADDRRYR